AAPVKLALKAFKQQAGQQRHRWIGKARGVGIEHKNEPAAGVARQPAATIDNERVFFDRRATAAGRGGCLIRLFWYPFQSPRQSNFFAQRLEDVGGGLISAGVLYFITRRVRLVCAGLCRAFAVAIELGGADRKDVVSILNGVDPRIHSEEDFKVG